MGGSTLVKITHCHDEDETPTNEADCTPYARRTARAHRFTACLLQPDSTWLAKELLGPSIPHVSTAGGSLTFLVRCFGAHEMPLEPEDKPRGCDRGCSAGWRRGRACTRRLSPAGRCGRVPLSEVLPQARGTGQRRPQTTILATKVQDTDSTAQAA